MRLHTLAEIEKGATQSLESPEIRVREPIRHEPTDAARRFDEQDALAIFRSGDGRGDPRGRRPIDQNIIILGPRTNGEQDENGEEREEQSAHPQWR